MVYLGLLQCFGVADVGVLLVLQNDFGGNRPFEHAPQQFKALPWVGLDLATLVAAEVLLFMQ